MSNINNRHRAIYRLATKYFRKYYRIIYKDFDGWWGGIGTNITIKPEWPIYLYYRIMLNKAKKYSKDKRG